MTRIKLFHEEDEEGLTPNPILIPLRRSNQPRKRTRKELLEQTRAYNIKDSTNWNKQKIFSIVSKVNKLLYKKHELQQLNKSQLENIANKYNIKVTLRKKKDEIIEAILKTQDSVFREIAASELSFHNDIIEHTKRRTKSLILNYKNTITFHKKM